MQYANDELDPDTATLWFAGKQLLPEKHLSDFLGRNDKSKAIVKLQKKGQGAPGREPVSPGLCGNQPGNLCTAWPSSRSVAPVGVHAGTQEVEHVHPVRMHAAQHDVLQAVDAETQKAMMAYYYKKQEEQKV